MSGPPGIEEACEEIVELSHEIDRQKVLVLLAEQRLADAQTVEKFWRNCAEQALRLWERERDDCEALEERVAYLERLVSA